MISMIAPGKEENAKSYRERWTKVIGSLREDLNSANVPVLVGQLGEFYAGPFARAVDEQLAIIPLRFHGPRLFPRPD